MEPTSSPNSTDEAFQAVAHPLRREMLCLLDLDEDGSMKREQMVDALATLYGSPEETISVALRHVHVPKLQEVGFVECDDRSDVIRYRESEFVSVLRENDLVECKTCSDEGRLFAGN